MEKLLLPALLFGALLLGLSLLRQSRWYHHRQLFRHLCQVHQLDRSARRLLRQVSRQLRLPYPAWVFIDPRCLAAAEQLPGIRLPLLLHLRNHLFGSLSSASSAPPQADSPQNSSSASPC